jgi:hypothetical protein
MSIFSLMEISGDQDQRPQPDAVDLLATRLRRIAQER